MKCVSELVCVFIVVVVEIFGGNNNVSGYMVGHNPHHRVETLDGEGKYQLEWIVDWGKKQVTFNVTVETKGWVGFGLSKNGEMNGADVIIGGVGAHGKSYFSDRHWVPEVGRLRRDTSQDWKLDGFWESDTHTFLSFTRGFDSCDPEDYPVTEDKISLIWMWGWEDDEDGLKLRSRGVFHVYLLAPEYTPPVLRDAGGKVTRVIGAENLTDMKTWTIQTKLDMPSTDTTYWCSIHQPPKWGKKQHIVGLEARFPTEASRKHTHHVGIYKCHAPLGMDAKSLYEPFVNHEGQACLNLQQPLGPMPTEYCTEYFQSWAVGGRIFFFPPNMGVPVGESVDEYYLVQIHYDNPDKLSNVVVETHIDLFYTSKLRPNDAGILVFRTPSPGLTPTILLPPQTVDHSVYTHCSPECTRRMLPKTGIHIAAAFLHAHNSGQRIRFQHFRQNKELPWIMSDENYGIDFQQFRPTRKEMLILPGDQLTVRCTYDTTWTNGTVLGGYSNKQEMCVGLALYYNKLENYGQCNSEIVSDEYRRHFLGVSNTTWDNSQLEYIVSSQDSPLTGLKISEVSDNHVNWDLDTRAELQRFHLYHPQINTCSHLTLNPLSLRRTSDGRLENTDDFTISVVYPMSSREYEPERSCSFQTN